MLINGHNYAMGPFADLPFADLHVADLRAADLSGADLIVANLRAADLTGANLSRADLTVADLTGADLTGANLSWANLVGADLTGADLTGADLTGADLSWANLSGAKGLRRPVLWESRGGWLYAYKAVTPERTGPQQRGLSYHDGERVSVGNADDSESLCSRGINVATRAWCEANHPGLPIIQVRFRRADIAAVPYGSDGKFRLHRCVVVGAV